MAGVTYKCPSCGAYLTFNPDTQKWDCPFCSSIFEENVLLEKAKEYEQQAQQSQPNTEPTADGGQVIYNCPSCGSQIMTSETTVATNCYYCHNPVVLQGKLTNEMRPDRVLPFSISKEKAVESFMAWVKKKRFVPKDFFSKAEVEMMTGVYYPHFVTDCELRGTIEGEGRNTNVVNSSKYITTHTEHYHVKRVADMEFQDVLRPALTSVNRKLSDGIHPFPINDAKPFSGAYLSGFLAERRDIEQSTIADDVKNELGSYVKPLLVGDLSYASNTVDSSYAIKEMKTEYVLLPTWVLTYPNKKDAKNPYYYVMNGRTGEVCGKLPIDKAKLNRTGALIAAGIFVVGCILSYFFV